ncbi:hypothetical protein GCK32_004152 [Trichostrongylus colubriformis]|uniref:Uncharacterized protein n=1 Tax=Trichostrongylus colubriformis TaxID=6319 RepID=A0AAN8IQ59_TRICO
MHSVMNPTYVSASDSGSEQDFEYGPGIVEKLKAKFQRLSATVSSEVKVSQHKTGKRFSSVDDILTTTEEIPRKCPITNGLPPSLLSQFSRLQSQSTGDMIDTKVSCRPFTVHRTVNTEEPNDIRGATISAIRRKFGAPLQRESAFSPRHAKAMSHAGAGEVANNNEDVVPEFIKVSQRLRKSSTLLRKGEEEDTRNISEKTSYHCVRSPKTCRAFSSNFVGIPTFSNNARVVSDDFCKETKPPRLENNSPPDPDPTRKRVSNTSDAKPAFAICTDDIFTTINTSPPPEEPTPSLDVNDYISGACAKEIRTSVPRNLRDNDKMGAIEVQCLLRKFQRSRSERQQEARASMAASELPSNLPPAVPKDRTYVHAVFGVRLSGLPASSTMIPINGSMALANPNVVRITVRSDSSTFSAKQSSCGSVMPPPSSLPPELRPPTEEEARKSLSPKYEERREFASPTVQGNDPTIETTKQQSDSKCATHGLRNSELQQTVLHDPMHLDGEPSTGDANLVHHSLLNLVMEEDIPALMEAMNETFTCEFEDLSEQSSSTSSILYTPERRKERRKARQVSSIRFEEANPKVYTYLDEISAIVKKEWVEGVHVDYETYRRILAAEVEEYKSAMTGLQEWNDDVNIRAMGSRTSHKGSNFNAVITSGLPYPLLSESNAMCV